MRLSVALKHFSTLKDIAIAIGVSPSTVADWKKKDGRIPEKYIPVLKKAMETSKPDLSEPLCFDEAMSLFGSTEKIASFFEVHPKTVHNWKSAGLIPFNSAQKLNKT